MPAARPDPEREVEKDPGAARQREEREDEPHERRIDAERVRDAAADAGDDAVAFAPLEAEDGNRGHGARTTSMWPAPTVASIVIGEPVPVSTRTSRAVVVAAERVDRPGLGVRRDRDQCVVRDDDPQLADPEVSP